MLVYRAAPEVLLHGQYSPASDVYCFGMLIWWVFNAFDLSSTGGVQTPDELSPLNRVPINEVHAFACTRSSIFGLFDVF